MDLFLANFVGMVLALSIPHYLDTLNEITKEAFVLDGRDPRKTIALCKELNSELYVDTLTYLSVGSGVIYVWSTGDGFWVFSALALALAGVFLCIFINLYTLRVSLSCIKVCEDLLGRLER